MLKTSIYAYNYYILISHYAHSISSCILIFSATQTTEQVVRRHRCVRLGATTLQLMNPILMQIVIFVRIYEGCFTFCLFVTNIVISWFE